MRDEKLTSVLRSYARLHAVYQILRFISPPQPTSFIMLQMPFVLAALVAPSKLTLVRIGHPWRGILMVSMQQIGKLARLSGPSLK